jgi:signal peptidase I
LVSDDATVGPGPGCQPLNRFTSPRRWAAVKPKPMYVQTLAIRRFVASWLLLAVVTGLLTTGCGTSGVAVTRDASVPIAVAHGGSVLSYVYRVPSGSMEPTLPIGARVVVKEGPPAIGAIVVYHPPEDFAVEECGPKPHVVRPGGAACDAAIREVSKIRLIKRIVAGPGDEIYIREGHVYRKADGSDEFVRESDPYIRVCGGRPECDFPDPIKIPAGRWFLMGDNRGESDDSRFWGPVPTAWIVGVTTDHILRRPYASIKFQSKRQSFRGVAIEKVAACLHNAGVEIPRSDSALLSSTSGIRTRSPRAKAAIGRCRSESLAAASR